MPEEVLLKNLLSKLVDETIDAEGLRALEKCLDESPEAQSYYLRYLDVHSELQQNGSKITASTERTVSKGARWLPSILSATAASVAIFAAALFFFNDEPHSIVQVVAGGGPVEWEGWNGETKTSPGPGTELSAGTISTLAAESWIEIAFPDGTSASLNGPSSLTVSLLEGRKILRLKKGNLSVDAAPQPQDLAMRIVTESAEAEVLGTQFNIRADSFSTQLTVNEGKVRMKRLADGKIEEVSANEELVAALEKGTAFVASPRGIPVHSWKSEVTRDSIQGILDQTPLGVAGIRAEPHIWKGEPNHPTEPILLYSAVFDPSPRGAPPLQIEEGARIVVTGWMDRSHPIHPGFATQHDKGGFAGKYAVFRGVFVEVDEDGRFQIELPVSSFIPSNPRFPKSSDGQEMMYFWINTVKSDAGLIVESVEVKR